MLDLGGGGGEEGDGGKRIMEELGGNIGYEIRYLNK